MPKREAEGLAMRWKAARAAKDYATADRIRSELRAVGIEAEDLVFEMELCGLSGCGETDQQQYGHGGSDVRGSDTATPVPYEPDPNDQLAYREHRTDEAKAIFQPTEAAAQHRDGGTGQGLTPSL